MLQGVFYSGNKKPLSGEGVGSLIMFFSLHWVSWLGRLDSVFSLQEGCQEKRKCTGQPRKALWIVFRSWENHTHAKISACSLAEKTSIDPKQRRKLKCRMTFHSNQMKNGKKRTNSLTLMNDETM